MKRYLAPDTIEKFVTNNKQYPFKEIGKSVNDRPIYGLQIGGGQQKVLLWSQMHGNESTTTRALLRFLKEIKEDKHTHLLDSLCLYIIPQLNPDGAHAFTRLNAAQVDLNRDAQLRSQPESQVFDKVVSQFKPDYSLNLHGQRTIFAAGKGGKPATLSFLAPAADRARTIPKQREEAMQLIASIKDDLTGLEGAIGRYDDGFNNNCVGDRLMQMGIPTLLFEAGHYPDDYQRNTTSQWVFKALIACFQHIADQDFYSKSQADYDAIPLNSKDFVDILLSNAIVKYKGEIFKGQQLAIQYREDVKDSKLKLTPLFHSFGSTLDLRGHKEIDLKNAENSKVFDFSVEKEAVFFENLTIE